MLQKNGTCPCDFEDSRALFYTFTSPHCRKIQHAWLHSSPYFTSKNRGRFHQQLEKNFYMDIAPGTLTCPLKRKHFKRIFIFQPLTFSGHVSFRKGTVLKKTIVNTPVHQNLKPPKLQRSNPKIEKKSTLQITQGNVALPTCEKTPPPHPCHLFRCRTGCCPLVAQGAIRLLRGGQHGAAIRGPKLGSNSILL